MSLPLFEPLAWRGLTLANRRVVGPMSRGEIVCKSGMHGEA